MRVVQTIVARSWRGTLASVQTVARVTGLAVSCLRRYERYQLRMSLSNPAPPSTETSAGFTGQLLDRHEDVAALADQIRSFGIMGVDTEFISERRYQPDLALLQVATLDGIYLIDPLAEHIQQAPDQPIWDAMADPSVRTIVHAFDQEARFCLQRTGQAPVDLFDVQLAAAFNGYHYPVAYDRLVGRELRRNVGPSQSRTDWMRRPLTDAQCRYAADDVRWLLPLQQRFVDCMSQDAADQRLRWLQEETSDRLSRMQDREAERWRRLRGANKLTARSLAALRTLVAWRETAAHQANLPVKRIAPDQLLTAIAASLPKSLAELSSVRGQEQLRSSCRADVLAAVAAGLAVPAAELPESNDRRARDKPSRILVLFLESILASACAPRQIDPDLVASTAQIRALIDWNDGGRPQTSKPALLRGWRGELCGDALLRALEGRVSLRISDPRSPNPLTVGVLGAE